MPDVEHAERARQRGAGVRVEPELLPRSQPLAADVQLLQPLTRGEAFDVRDGVAVQVELLQVRARLQSLDASQRVVLEVEVRERREGRQVGYASDGVIVQVEHPDARRAPQGVDARDVPPVHL